MKEKMKFDEFKDAVVEGIKDWLPDSFETANISLQVVTKNNDTKLTGLVITKAGSNIAPTIYLESFFETYENGDEMSDILRRIADVRMQNDASDFDVSQITKFENCKDKIFPRLVGAMYNEDLLARRPHILIEDLAVTFYIDLGEHEEQMMSVPIQYELMKGWGCNEEDLYSLALKNLADSNSGTFLSMSEVMRDMLMPNIIEDCGGDEEAAEQIFDSMLAMEEPKMYVLSNKKKTNGACMLLDPNMMKKIIDKIGTEFYILPSSIHECIVIPADAEMNANSLKNMVCEVNETQVAWEERLSDAVYTYTSEEGLKIA